MWTTTVRLISWWPLVPAWCITLSWAQTLLLWTECQFWFMQSYDSEYWRVVTSQNPVTVVVIWCFMNKLELNWMLPFNDSETWLLAGLLMIRRKRMKLGFYATAAQFYNPTQFQWQHNYSFVFYVDHHFSFKCSCFF